MLIVLCSMILLFKGCVLSIYSNTSDLNMNSSTDLLVIDSSINSTNNFTAIEEILRIVDFIRKMKEFVKLSIFIHHTESNLSHHNSAVRLWHQLWKMGVSALVSIVQQPTVERQVNEEQLIIYSTEELAVENALTMMSRLRPLYYISADIECKNENLTDIASLIPADIEVYIVSLCDGTIYEAYHFVPDIPVVRAIAEKDEGIGIWGLKTRQSMWMRRKKMDGLKIYGKGFRKLIFDRNNPLYDAMMTSDRYAVDVWNDLTKFLNFTLVVVEGVFERNSANSTPWDGMIALLDSEEIDVPINLVTVTEQVAANYSMKATVFTEWFPGKGLTEFIMSVEPYCFMDVAPDRNWLLTDESDEWILEFSTQSKDSLPHNICSVSSTVPMVPVWKFLKLNFRLMFHSPLDHEHMLMPNFLNPFDERVWLVLVCMLFFLLPPILAVLLRKETEFGNAAILPLRCITSQGLGFTPVGTSARVGCLVTLFFCYLMVLFYESLLITFLTSNRSDQPFNTLEEFYAKGYGYDLIYHTDISWALLGDWEESVSENSDPVSKLVQGFPPPKPNRVLPMGSRVEAGKQLCKNPRNTSIFDVSYRQGPLIKCAYITTKHKYLLMHLGIGARHNLSAYPFITKMVRSMDEYGIIDRMKQTFRLTQHKSTFKPLSYHELGTIFFIFHLAVLFSVIIFALELLWFYCQKMYKSKFSLKSKATRRRYHNKRIKDLQKVLELHNKFEKS